MSSNFDFLQDHFPALVNFGSLAEKYLYSDSNSCLMKLGMIGETIVKLCFDYDKIPLPHDDSAVSRIDTLFREGMIDRDLSDILHALRKIRNKAAHENYSSVSDGKALLQMAHSLCEWFMQVYGDYNYQNTPFIMPLETSETIAPTAPAKQSEKAAETQLIAEAEKAAAAAPAIVKPVRQQRSAKAASQRVKSEAETRYLIDEQLRKVGWEADTENLRYSKGTRPVKGRSLAIAEWPTDSAVGDKGRADYALFIGLKLVALIEAKAIHKDISSVIDHQCKDYASHIRQADAEYQLGAWGEYKVPFVFAANGRPYLAQYETKSGIWFLDLRQPDNAAKPLRGWMSPTGIAELLAKDITAQNAALQKISYDLLCDKDGLNLRYYQIKAIEAAEKAVLQGQPNILLAMATGTGKTRTVLGLIYRFLKSGRFRRILFIVDRTALGEQAADVFKEVKLEELQTLANIYNLKELTEKNIEKETRIQIATVQSMVKRIIYNSEDDIPAVSDFDLVIIDEAHRGYILDKEMGEAEILYRDQLDYQSKYRSVVEYFDAVKIALTATPALHTTEIFGRPVFQYTYREAVIDGYLVDHDAPHELKTKLSESGIHYKKGDSLSLFDKATGEITNAELLADELDFDIEAFNKQVITEPFNRAVLAEIAKDIDPDSPDIQGKTLIFAANDDHADLIVKILKEIYTAKGVDNDAIMKITASVGGCNKKKVLDAIKRFKNENFPSIVVTVDLLTTGIDVPEITTLVFMRRVKSRILFEQMMGRATRLCPAINKTHFEIYDPVGVYDSLDPVNKMKPVVANPSASFAQLLDGLKVMDDEAQIHYQVNQIIAKLQRKKRNISEDTLEHFINLTNGKNIDQFISGIRQSSPHDAKERLLAAADVFKLLDEAKPQMKNPVVVSDHPDEVISHERGFGKGQKPADYLDAFAEFVKTNPNQIAALQIVCTRPSELTRDSLKSLRLSLDREGFTEKQLNTAIHEMTNEAITADIISLIRRYAIGSPLLSHEERIKRATSRLKKAHDFSKQELNWIERIEQYLLNESILNVAVFDEDSRFKAQGGFSKLNKVFGSSLANIVQELNNYLYEDGEASA